MTTLLSLTKQSRCVIPDDAKVIRAQLTNVNDINIVVAYLVVNGKETYYHVGIDQIIYDNPLELHKGDILEVKNAGSATVNILVKTI